MRLRFAIPGLLCCLFGLVFVVATAVNPLLLAESTTSDKVPGAGFFPYLMGSICILLGLVLAVRGMMRGNAGQADETKVEGWDNRRKLLLCIAAIVVFLLLWVATDQFFIGSILLCLYLNHLFERSWKFNLIYTALFCTFVYVVFTYGFSIQFVA